jgi:hypothetical protein
MSKPQQTIDPRLKACFAALSKPAQRALISNGIFSESDLAKWTFSDVKKMHGIGPSAVPILNRALVEARLKLKSDPAILRS